MPRWSEAGATALPAWARSAILLTTAQFLALLAALYVNRHVAEHRPTLWFGLQFAVAAALATARFTAAERPVVRLWQMVGSLSAVYSLLHYPLMPVADGATAAAVYVTLILAWLATLSAGVLCYRVPSLAILPPAFLLWSNDAAGAVTGLPTTTWLDVAPLPEVSACIGLGLLIARVSAAVERRIWRQPVETDFAALLLLAAIAVHLANYFWSFWTKMTLAGPPGAWLLDNNPVYIFLTGLDDGHILYAGYPALVAAAYRFIDATHLYANAWVLACQGAALFGFLLPKRGLFVLLLFFDAMHLAIIAVVGANFWPWILLNVVITIAVARSGGAPPSTALRLLATLLILIAPHVVFVARLGWYDTGANNKLFFEAVDASGARTPVPANFFTYYSYSIGHMDYGAPDPATAFATGEPNGGAWDYRLLEAGRRCDVAALEKLGRSPGVDRRLAAFVRNYHRLALAIEARLGAFPYQLYPHHFYSPPSQHAAFDALDKRRIVAYIYRRESVCLSFADGALRRRVATTAEDRIDVDSDARH